MYSRRDVLRTGLLAGAGLVAPMINRGRFALFAAPEAEISSRAVELVGRSTVVDMLGLLTLDWPRLYGWFREPASFTEADFRRISATGTRVFHPAVDPQQADPRRAALEWTASWSRFLDGQPKRFRRVGTAADLVPAANDPRLGLMVGFQDSSHFQSTGDVALFHGLGQRVSQLTYNDRNRLGSGCKDPTGPLTEFGAKVVREMNRVGMAVDVSHCSDRTTLDAVAVSSRPVLITHSNCRALVAHPRCKPDAVIQAVAARGGVMGITVVPAFVRQAGPASLDAVLDHFEHVARLVGVEHVGIGSDVDADALDASGRLRPRYAIPGLSLSHRVFALTEGLIRRGWTDSQIELVLGGNFQRVLAEIWTPPASARPA
jgi:membrane dipeptidase